MLVWMHKPGMAANDKIASYGSASGGLVYFTQDRVVAIPVIDLPSHTTAVSTAGGTLYTSDLFTLKKSPVALANFVAPSGITYSLPYMITRPILNTDIAAVEERIGQSLQAA